MVKALVSLSGGMDSSTVLAKAIDDCRLCEAVSFYYGSTHNKFENEASRKIARHFDVAWHWYDLSNIFTSNKSALLGSLPIPEGHYNDETMRQTVVPGRNLIFISILASLAEANGFDEVWLGIHQGDHHIYPDCRPMFFYRAFEAVQASTEKKVKLMAPFIGDDKAKILKIGYDLSVPYYLTRTCYKEQDIACGKCGACRERLEAFEKNGITDPIRYE